MARCFVIVVVPVRFSLFFIDLIYFSMSVHSNDYYVRSMFSPAIIERRTQRTLVANDV